MVGASLESVTKMSDDRQYALATLRNRDFILDVLRGVLPTTGVILEVASGSGEHVCILPEISRASFSNHPYTCSHGSSAVRALHALPFLSLTLHLIGRLASPVRGKPCVARGLQPSTSDR
jgi:hypothetical protein